MSNFKLYPKEQHWCSFRDYQAVLDGMKRTGARRVLEFGPGSTSLALVEGGATSIDTCEDSPQWATIYESRLVKRFPEIVRLHRYQWPQGEQLSIPAIAGRRFDLALIDGPRSTERRPDVLRYALERSKWVLMPTEEHNTRPWLRLFIIQIAEKAKHKVEFTETGPLAGAFALVGPTC